ncbi:GMC family oxidoreductase [Bradyrhizobium diazoefficiens]|nr:GMC family oxidoreductase [Bradyrhizobium diazoefficiens]QQO23428.1 GMC family oxidoreductase [Bradyrhizobium diazoefficiens]
MSNPETDLRATNGRAPDVFRRGAWVPMREYSDDEEVDFAVVGTGAGGGTLAARLAEHGFKVVALDAGPFWRPLEDFASDEKEQNKLYWLQDRISGGQHPIEFGANNSGRSVGGSTVHFQMVALRWRPEWFAARSKLGYGRDWPIDWREIWRYYAEAEDALKISGPISYPWGPPRGRYPYRAHEINAAGLVLAKGAEALGVKWAAVPLSTLSAPRGKAPPCVYRGFCKVGCSTNAKQSVLNTFIPRALAAGAEIRDLATVSQIEMGSGGRATGLVYHRQGQWRRQRARHVVVSGYAIETPRLLLNSATAQQPQGLANSSGMVGKCLMTHANHAVWGVMEDEIRWYKGPPSMTVCEHWNYEDRGKDFHGGYAFMSQGPLPADHAKALVSNTGMFGMQLRQHMALYNHMAGLKIVGEVEPHENNRIELSDQTDELGIPLPRITFSFSENDQRLYKHSLQFMRRALESAGASNLIETASTAHLMGTCRMGTSASDSVTNADGRTWDIPNLWICDGSLFPTCGGVNPSMTIYALALRAADRIKALAGRGEL